MIEVTNTEVCDISLRTRNLKHAFHIRRQIQYIILILFEMLNLQN